MCEVRRWLCGVDRVCGVKEGVVGSGVGCEREGDREVVWGVER